MNLAVARLDASDVYKDMARIPQEHRFDVRGKVVHEGQICRVRVRDRSATLSIRGYSENSAAVIRVDERTRARLEVTIGDEADFSLTPVGFPGQFAWAWRASDPAYRIAARLGLISVILGALGFALGAAGLLIPYMSL